FAALGISGRVIAAGPVPAFLVFWTFCPAAGMAIRGACGTPLLDTILMLGKRVRVTPSGCRWHQLRVPSAKTVALLSSFFSLATKSLQRDVWEEMHDPSHDDREW